VSADKDKRRSLIIEIVTGTPVSSQEQLLEVLAARGVRTTQATISRDIRELGLVKLAVSPDSYRYLPGAGKAKTSGTGLLGEAVQSIKLSGHLLVILTRPGFAQSVAGAVDSLDLDELLGSVGGDDTVLIVARDSEAALSAGEHLARYFSVELD
jgi:transcriptional regulator of arginine metabolism